MKSVLLIACLVIINYKAQAQGVGINTPTPHSSAILDIESTNRGFLLPRIANPNTIVSPATGLLVYNTTTDKFNYYDGVTWKEVGGSDYTGGTGIIISGNTISHEAHTGDATGASALTVVGLQNRPLSATAPASGQVIKWNGSAWTPGSDENTTYTAGTGLSISGTTINSVWTASGNNIFNNNSGNVGIGVAPGAKLDVAGSARIRGASSNGTFSDAGQIALKRENNSPFISFHADNGTRQGYVQVTASSMILQNTGTIRATALSGTGSTLVTASSNGTLSRSTGRTSEYVATRDGSASTDVTTSMITASEGFCFLTGVRGAFNGDGESCRVFVSSSTWVLQARRAGGGGVICRAICYRF